MSGLSDNAKRLAETLCGADYEMADGGIRGGLDHAADGHHFLHKYDTAALLEIASAALELAGVKVESTEDKLLSVRQVKYKDAKLRQVYGREGWLPPFILVTETDFDMASALQLALTLLHAARTAREWASEGGIR